eukprot:TRINITY_DN3138_c1_g1_i1.p1 TRINITY_DN3138_c1_g1~~TRINITY_DN3138_c1_g1_i1.p1  ORF type:complete len:389 (+),score=71.27 TRINITY_DN3138_c1_g1_i1:100-1266(+)
MATDEDGWNTVGKGKKTQPKAAKVVEEKGKKPPPKPKKKQQPKPAPPTQPDQEKKLVIGTIENYNFELNTKHTGYQFKGCTNHGNECYHIAVFQGLLACPGFLNFAKTIPTGDSLPTTLTALKAVLQEFRGAPGSPANIYTLLQSMSRTFKQARAKEQADASEYLIHLLTTLDDELQSILPKPTEAARQEDGWETIGKGSRSRGVEHTTGESSVSPITQLFRGTMASRLASRGAKPSVTLQPFTVLPLDIVDDRFHSVAAFLQDWASPQRVELASGEGTKQMVFSSMPPILIVCLKLWSPTLQQKSTKTIQVTENLAIHPSVTTTRTKIEYSLHAAVCHKGGDVTRGHYTAFIKKGDKWALADDSRVTPIHSIGAACTDPYLLFYCRK